MNKGLDEYMSTNWHPDADETEDGFVITVPALEDFAVHGDTEKEAWADYPDALRSHLAGYIAVDKVVPVPFKIAQTAGEPKSVANAEFVKGFGVVNAFGVDVRTGLRYETAGG